MRVLVADDDPEMLELVSGIVRRELAADVTRATTGHELLDQLAHGEWDLIITDISMPWMTGVQVMQSARTAGLPVPVVVMTALRGSEVAGQVEALGDRALLIRKPFSLEDLLAAVRDVKRAA